jgi:hypothetical protein
MTSLNEYPQKHSPLSFKMIVSILAFSLVPILFPFTNCLAGTLENTKPDVYEGTCATEENQDNQAMLNSTVFLHVASDDPRYEDRGLGTVIGGHTIVTAKHVVSMAIGREEIPGLRINDLVISGPIKERYSYYPDQGETSGTDIMRIDLPSSYDGSLPASAHVASLDTINAIGIGACVSVVYYDHARNQLTVGKFRVIEIGNGLAKLDDPSKIIVPGDSGGGVYYNGALIGLTTSIINVVSTIDANGKTIEQKQYQCEFWITLISPAFR